jgi:hypothetical protein
MSSLLLLTLLGCGADFWDAPGALAVARHQHAAVVLPDGDVLIVGGVDANGATLRHAERWRPGEATTTLAAELPEARAGLSATLLGDGRVLVVGGRVGANPHRDAWTYDPAADAWTPAGEVRRPRADHDALSLPDGSVVVHGGFADPNGPGPERFDPASGVWEELDTDFPTAVGVRTIFDGSRLFATGGFVEDEEALGGLALTPGSHAVAPAGGASTTQAMVQPRAFHVAAPWPGGGALVAGGHDEAELSRFAVLDSIEITSGGDWTTIAQLPGGPRTGILTAPMAAGAVLLLGGHNGDPSDASDSVVAIDPAQGGLAELAPLPAPLRSTAAVRLRDGRVATLGGHGPYLATGEIFVYTPDKFWRVDP